MDWTRDKSVKFLAGSVGLGLVLVPTRLSPGSIERFKGCVLLNRDGPPSCAGVGIPFFRYRFDEEGLLLSLSPSLSVPKDSKEWIKRSKGVTERWIFPPFFSRPLLSFFPFFLSLVNQMQPRLSSQRRATVGEEETSVGRGACVYPSGKTCTNSEILKFLTSILESDVFK